MTPRFESLEPRLLLSASALGEEMLVSECDAISYDPVAVTTSSTGHVGDSAAPSVALANIFGVTTQTVLAGGDFQAAINAAAAGDVIELEAGATFTGNFILPARGGTDLITIRSTAHAALPNGRVGAVDAPLMPKIVSPNSMPAIRGLFGSSNYLLDGLEIYSTHSLTNNLVLFGYEFGAGRYANTLSEFSDNITIDRSYIHGDSVNSIQHAVHINGSNITVSRSEVSEIHGVGFDTQAFLAIFGPGPYTLDNNLLEAAGENILFGGAGPTSSIAALIAANPEFNPQGIAITRNTISKPDRWNDLHPDYDGSNWSVKNLVEFKIGRDIVVAGNFIENVWSDAQDGPAIVITPREASIDNVEIRDNVIRHARYALQANPANHELSNVVIENNLIYQLEYRIFEAVAPTNKQIDNLTIRNNTALFGDNATNGGLGSTNLVTGDTDAAITNLIYQDNILSSGYYGIHGSGQAPGLGTIQYYVIGFDVRGNAIINPYPASANTIYLFNNNYESGGDFYGDFSRYDTIDLVGFDDLTFEDIQDFRVTNNAAIQSAGTGVDIDALLAALGLSVVAPGDFNGDSVVTADDIDALADAIRLGLTDPIYDLSGPGEDGTPDSVIDVNDLDYLVHTLVETTVGVGTEYGDFNLDGVIDTADLTRLATYFGGGELDPRGWAQGNANRHIDLVIDTTDLTILATYYGFVAPPTPPAGGGAGGSTGPVATAIAAPSPAEDEPPEEPLSLSTYPSAELGVESAEKAELESAAALLSPTSTRLTESRTELPVSEGAKSVRPLRPLRLRHRQAASRRLPMNVPTSASTDMLPDSPLRSRMLWPVLRPSDLPTDLVNIFDEIELPTTL